MRHANFRVGGDIHIINGIISHDNTSTYHMRSQYPMSVNSRIFINTLRWSISYVKDIIFHVYPVSDSTGSGLDGKVGTGKVNVSIKRDSHLHENQVSWPLVFEYDW